MGGAISDAQKAAWCVAEGGVDWERQTKEALLDNEGKGKRGAASLAQYRRP